MKVNIASKELVHFIGIGGIGMSGLAQIMTNMGFKVQGSDLNNNKNIERLKNSGIKIYVGHRKSNIHRATMIVASSAIKKNNLEILTAKKRNLPIFRRGEMLANVVSLKKKYCGFRIPWQNYNHFFNFKYISRGWIGSYRN